jgi:hypothetical protein
VVTAVSAGTAAAGNVIVNPYWTGGAGWPGGGFGLDTRETEETAAELNITGEPTFR